MRRIVAIDYGWGFEDAAYVHAINIHGYIMLIDFGQAIKMPCEYELDRQLILFCMQHGPIMDKIPTITYIKDGVNVQIRAMEEVLHHGNAPVD